MIWKVTRPMNLTGRPPTARFDCYRHPAEASREAAHGACTRIAIRGRRGSRTCRESPHDGETSCQSICCVPTSTQPPARLQWRTMYIAKFAARRSTSLIREAAERCFVLPQCECRLNARPANTVGLVRWRCDPVSRGGCVRVGLQIATIPFTRSPTSMKLGATSAGCEGSNAASARPPSPHDAHK